MAALVVVVVVVVIGLIVVQMGLGGRSEMIRTLASGKAGNHGETRGRHVSGNVAFCLNACSLFVRVLCLRVDRGAENSQHSNVLANLSVIGYPDSAELSMSGCELSTAVSPCLRKLSLDIFRGEAPFGLGLSASHLVAVVSCSHGTSVSANVPKEAPIRRRQAIFLQPSHS